MSLERSAGASADVRQVRPGLCAQSVDRAALAPLAES